MRLRDESKAFILTCYDELEKSTEDARRRWADVLQSIERDGTYEHTHEELEHGARMAWRNSNRCIGRLFWQSLKVFDERRLDTADEVLSALRRHIDYASNGGKIRPAITVFGPKIRLWNHQLIRYAGYETDEGIVGDPHSVSFTKICQILGWDGEGTPFDLLPLVVQREGQVPQWSNIAKDDILEVRIAHPEYPSFSSLGLKWYAVPLISDMALEIGGIRYPAAPFNGWYMETEIGARNLADPQRYDMLPKVGEILRLNTASEATLWRDKALVELNIAVLHSFKAQGVTIVDHHTAAGQFERFEQLEAQAGRLLTGDWTWLIPPVSPATTHVFHNHYDNVVLTPNFFRQNSPY